MGRDQRPSGRQFHPVGATASLALASGALEPHAPAQFRPVRGNRAGGVRGESHSAANSSTPPRRASVACLSLWRASHRPQIGAGIGGPILYARTRRSTYQFGLL